MQRVAHFALGDVWRLPSRREPGADHDLRLLQQRPHLWHDRGLDFRGGDPTHDAAIVVGLALRDALR